MINTGLEKIYVKELKEQLHLTDLRSVKRYCLLNGIAILKDKGCRSAYAMRSDYEAARMREFIKMLKKRHGKDWLKAYQAHVNFDIEFLSALQGASRKNHSDGNKHKLIISTGKNGQRFLDELNNLIE
jgi:hypothetical protein